MRKQQTNKSYHQMALFTVILEILLVKRNWVNQMRVKEMVGAYFIDNIILSEWNDLSTRYG